MSSKEPNPTSALMRHQRALGHGHVVPRDDGTIARCGGPAICDYCRDVKAILDSVTRYNATQGPQLRLVIDGESRTIERVEAPDA